MTTIDPYSSAAAAAGSNQAGSSQASSSQINQFSDPQLFLKLLVAELQNQDPTSPTSPSSIMQQSAMLSQVEAVNTMTTAITSEQVAAQNNEATGLIGRTITATVSGKSLSGAVSAVGLNASGAPTLTVNGTQVPLASITAVS